MLSRLQLVARRALGRVFARTSEIGPTKSCALTSRCWPTTSSREG